VPYLPTMPTFLVRFDCTISKQTSSQPSFTCKTRTHNSLVTIREPPTALGACSGLSQAARRTMVAS
jgi:hypothetical protein